ncbi:MAG: SPOR domain-containing protein [Ectothiorhodospiraceae bacterium]|nr:SPOR domain-containing protein [Chromatiales bacterium]MCP5156463.1 SPOR domain-containing protein [Ectothiorhodospiraceae bacterium]
MRRDYKQPARKSRTRPARRPPSRIAWFAVGFASGITAALVVYLKDFGGLTIAERADELVSRATGTTPADGKGASGKPRFEFYTLLPEMEVAVPDEEVAPSRPRAATTPPPKPAAATATPPAAGAPRYLLQVGSFRRAAEAERLKASLALLGLEADVQSIADSESVAWYRVRLGPYSDVDRLNEARSRLRDNGIEAMVMRIRG